VVTVVAIMVILKADGGAKGRNMQHTDSRIEYTVVSDGDVTVGVLVIGNSRMTYTKLELMKFYRKLTQT
jgi:hypothetical protein